MGCSLAPVAKNGARLAALPLEPPEPDDPHPAKAAAPAIPAVPTRKARRVSHGDPSCLPVRTGRNLSSVCAPLGSPVTTFTLDGREVMVADESCSLAEALRDRLGARTVKDGCWPQGQCGCCTVLVDGQPRVACVTPVRRVTGRSVTTVDGLESGAADGWASALVRTGGSQCGFCTPGIVVRLEALRARDVDRSL